jgi:small subunit ribosomal protein S16
MSVRIRLRRIGKRNQGCHRIVVTDIRSPRDGRFIEKIGFYDPRHKTETLDLARAEYWLSCGAQPTETVGAIIKRARAGKPMNPADAAAKRAAAQAKTPKKKKKEGEEAQATAATAPAAEPAEKTSAEAT